MPTVMTKQRPRYGRGDPASWKPFRLREERDVPIIQAVRDHDLLSLFHILKLFPQWSEQTTRRRLREMFSRNYLAKPKNQHAFFQPGTNSPDIYGLGTEAKAVLEKYCDISLRTKSPTRETFNASHIFIEHTVETSSVMVLFELACRASGVRRPVYLDEILKNLPNEKLRNRKRPKEWAVNITWYGSKVNSIGIKPDKIFAIEDSRLPPQQNKAYFFLELDRGPETIDTDKLGRSSILEKLIKYAYTHTNKRHHTLFGAKNFRVLFVITTKTHTVAASRARIVKCVTAYRDHVSHIVPGGLFLFADQETLEASGDPFSIPWINGRGEPTML